MTTITDIQVAAQNVLTLAENYGADSFQAGRADAASTLLPQLDAANAEIARLQAQLAAQQPRPLLGATASRGTGETYATAASRVMSTLNPQALRIYDDGYGATHVIASAQQTGQFGKLPMVLSFKYPPGEVASGGHDAAINAAVAACPTGVVTYLCFDHEADVKIQQGQYTIGDFLAGFVRFAGLVHAQPNRNVKATLILTGWDQANRLPQYGPALAACDAFGIDPYCHQQGVTASAFLAPLLATIRKYTTVPVLVTELGYIAADGKTPLPGLTDFVRSLADVRGVDLVSWFHAGPWALTGDAVPAFKTLTGPAA